MAKLKIGVFGGYRGHTMINVLFNHDDAEACRGMRQVSARFSTR